MYVTNTCAAAQIATNKLAYTNVLAIGDDMNGFVFKYFLQLKLVLSHRANKYYLYYFFSSP